MKFVKWFLSILIVLLVVAVVLINLDQAVIVSTPQTYDPYGSIR